MPASWHLICLCLLDVAIYHHSRILWSSLQMSLIADLASSTSVLLWGPPAPVSKDPPPPPPERMPKVGTASPALSPSPFSRRAALLSPNLGLNPEITSMSAAKANGKADDIPLPPPPLPELDQRAAKATPATLLGSGLSLLGSAVIGLGSAAASAISSSSDADKPTPSQDTFTSRRVEDAETGPETLLTTISNAVLGRAASIRDAAFESLTDTATGLASSALNLATAHPPPTSNRIQADDTPRPPQPERASTLPIQYTASGEPFSSNPSISAMQRIPDHPCGHIHTHHSPLTHCCSAPQIPCTTPTIKQRDQCDCKCDQRPVVEKCQCICHSDSTVYSRRQSGHFHRVEQLVRATKRVVRDMRNVV